MIKKEKILIILGVVIILGIVLIKNEKNKNINEEKIIENKIYIRENMIEEENHLENQKIKVHITGEVNNPGLIELNVGSRVNDAIELAGGLTEQADVSKTNLAYILSDGEKIYIPNKNDEINENNILQNSNSKININLATVSELQTIPGVGESTAKSILEYREKNGKFMLIDDIKNVSGIGESKFEKMKEYITIK